MIGIYEVESKGELDGFSIDEIILTQHRTVGGGVDASGNPVWKKNFISLFLFHEDQFSVSIAVDKISDGVVNISVTVPQVNWNPQDGHMSIAVEALDGALAEVFNGGVVNSKLRKDISPSTRFGYEWEFDAGDFKLPNEKPYLSFKF